MTFNPLPQLFAAAASAFVLSAAAQGAVSAPSAPAPTEASKAQTVASQVKTALNNVRPVVLCDACGTVESVIREKRKGKGGAIGMVGGAVAGGVLGNQVGDGSGKKVATVAGAVGGAVLGNEIQKRMNSKKVYVTTVKMKDGSLRKFEQEAQPTWAAGAVVKVGADNAIAAQ